METVLIVLLMGLVVGVGALVIVRTRRSEEEASRQTARDAAAQMGAIAGDLRRIEELASRGMQEGRAAQAEQARVDRQEVQAALQRGQQASNFPARTSTGWSPRPRRPTRMAWRRTRRRWRRG